MNETDCLIIGAGPAGLTAAIYLARYRRRVMLIDSGESRARLIPVSHNLPGYPAGIAGEELLQRLQMQAAGYGLQVTIGRVRALQRHPGAGFSAELDSGEILQAPCVLLATGIADKQLAVANWEAAVRQGCIRLCPICDAFEAMNQNIAMIVGDEDRVKHALFMKTYTDRLTLFCNQPAQPLTEQEQQQLTEAGIAWSAEAATAVTLTAAMKPVVRLANGQSCEFDVVYPMLGEKPRAELALELGAACEAEGCLVVSNKQCTSVPGLYAAGDVVNTLNQISVACGQAAIAATAIHNRLREISGHAGE